MVQGRYCGVHHAPRVFQQESLPSAPTWSEIQKLLSSMDGDTPSAIRDRSILMVLAIYGVRAGEVARLQLGDIDWDEESIVSHVPSASASITSRLFSPSAIQSSATSRKRGHPRLIGRYS